MSNAMPATALTKALSADRFGRYLAATPSAAAALELYEWNAKLSAAVMHLTGMVEVTVRNAMDDQLVTWYAEHSAGEWWDSGRLDRRGAKDVKEAKRRAGRDRSHGRIVAELNFGFWRFLVGSRYLTTFLDSRATGWVRGPSRHGRGTTGLGRASYAGPPFRAQPCRSP